MKPNEAAIVRRHFLAWAAVATGAATTRLLTGCSSTEGAFSGNGRDRSPDREPRTDDEDATAPISSDAGDGPTQTDDGGDGGSTQTLGVGGVATPLGAILTTSDSSSVLKITSGGTATSPKVYDGQRHTVGGIKISADYVTVQNFHIRGAGNAGVYSIGTGVTIQNCEITRVNEGGEGDINGITFFGDGHKILYNRIGPNLVEGNPKGSHTDGVQTWNTPSKRSSSNVLILGNWIEGPTTTSDKTYIHQGVMAEGANSTDGGGGGSGVSQNWLIDSNYFGTAGNQCLKFDDIDNVHITRNTFAGNARHVIESTELSSGTKYYSDNVVTGDYGDIGVAVSSGSGPSPSGWGYAGGN